ncbi:hypothetical protein Nepgr_023835 [Nepenthes gracilis]|uniref:F-box domain-containing protein n=1 Tax=Nepenthes gracilis TaxID=150966 RepID=A0AAD3T4M5_NEPGR|nr:hypothetical protein Nepgr_023835 [Nepenthes gracilis]
MEPFCTTVTSPIPYTSYIIATASASRCDLPANTTTFATAASSAVSPWMDSRIWSRLPHRLLDRVLTFLPPPAFFRARSVCKRWYALLYSSSFLQLYLQTSSSRHCFIFFNHKSIKSHIYRNNGCANSSDNDNGSSSNRMNGRSNYNYDHAYLFDPYEMAWHRLSFPLIPPGFSPSSCSHGLICWVSEEAGPKSLFLHNPLLGTLTQLPVTLRPRLFPSIGLRVTSNSIDLAVAGDDLISPYAVKNLTTESFHIDGGGFYSIWGTTSPLPRLCSLESGHMAHNNGRFYCMNYNPFSVLTYDISSNTWWKVQAPMRRFLRSPSLVELEQKLILIAAVDKSKLNVPRSLRLWCLQPCGSSWVEVERMPQQLYLQFAEVEDGKGFDCVGHGQFAVIMMRGMNKAVIFDTRRKIWGWMPPCPYVNGGELHGFGYEPKLATPVTALLDHLSLPFQSSFID